MNILESIRKNSILVLIAIVGVGVGLLMSDYGQKGSMLSNEYSIKVDDVSYNSQEAYALASNAESIILALTQAVPSRVRNHFDIDGDQTLNENEISNVDAWFNDHPEIQVSRTALRSVLDAWSYGEAQDFKMNIAINRSLLSAEAKSLGIYPSKDQIDIYIENLFAFKKMDGSFDKQLYRRLSGFRGEMADPAVERMFRSVIADIIVWDALRALITDGVQTDARAEMELINVLLQDFKGMTAWIAASTLPAIANPSDEELKTFWEANKDSYLSDDRRVVSLYTLKPSKDVSMNDLLGTGEYLMQDIAQSDGRGIADLIAIASENPENVLFSYKTADGKSHVTLPSSSINDLPELLLQGIESRDGSIPIGELAFEVEGAPSLEDYKKALADNKPLESNIKQIRGFYPTEQGSLLMICVEAIDAPKVLSFEMARKAALVDYIKEKKNTQLADYAKKIFADMEKLLLENKGIDAAIALAKSAGAEISDFGPVSMEGNIDLPLGLNPEALIAIAKNTLAPLAMLEDGARITLLTERSYADSPEMSSLKSSWMLPLATKALREKVMVDWMHQAYRQYNVQLSPKIKLAR